MGSSLRCKLLTGISLPSARVYKLLNKSGDQIVLLERKPDSYKRREEKENGNLILRKS